MDTVTDLIMALHFIGLAMGGVATFGLPVIGAMIDKAPPEHRPSIGAIVLPIKNIVKAGMAMLIVTGIILVFTSGVTDAAPGTFWLKLLLVAALVASIVVADKTGPKAMTGDAAAKEKIKKLGILNKALLVLIVLLAVISFH
ncbi:MAG: hypothetical protein GKR98_08640 [Boseongicola sp.]|nr:MAG: hypothetical protein GKR98_08640 [Boseongicola sp.]